MAVGEAHALGGEPVDVWRGDFSARGIVALHVAVAEVVGEDDEEVGFGGVGGRGRGGGEGEKEGKREGEKARRRERELRKEAERGENVHGVAAALVFRRSMGASLGWRGPGVLRPSAT